MPLTPSDVVVPPPPGTTPGSDSRLRRGRHGGRRRRSRGRHGRWPSWWRSWPERRHNVRRALDHRRRRRGVAEQSSWWCSALVLVRGRGVVRGGGGCRSIRSRRTRPTGGPGPSGRPVLYTVPHVWCAGIAAGVPDPAPAAPATERTSAIAPTIMRPKPAMRGPSTLPVRCFAVTRMCASPVTSYSALHSANPALRGRWSSTPDTPRRVGWNLYARRAIRGDQIHPSSAKHEE